MESRYRSPPVSLREDGASMRHVKFRAVHEVTGAIWVEEYLLAALAQSGLDADLGDARTVIRPRRA